MVSEAIDGKRLFEQELWDEAYPLLTKEASVERTPGLATLYLAVIEASRQQNAGLLRDVMEKVSPDVDKASLLQVVGTALYDMGHTEEGVALLEKGAADYGSAYCMASLASRLYQADGGLDRAGELYEELQYRKGYENDALVNLAGINIERGQAKEAEKKLRQVLGASPKHMAAHYELGNALAMQDMFARGLKHYRVAAEGNYWRPACAWAGVAYCHMRLGHKREAIAGRGSRSKSILTTSMPRVFWKTRRISRNRFGMRSPRLRTPNSELSPLAYRLAPSGLRKGVGGPEPRALPWAGESQAFGLEQRRHRTERKRSEVRDQRWPRPVWVDWSSGRLVTWSIGGSRGAPLLFIPQLRSPSCRLPCRRRVLW